MQKLHKNQYVLDNQLLTLGCNWILHWFDIADRQFDIRQVRKGGWGFVNKRDCQPWPRPWPWYGYNPVSSSPIRARHWTRCSTSASDEHRFVYSRNEPFHLLRFFNYLQGSSTSKVALAILRQHRKKKFYLNLINHSFIFIALIQIENPSHSEKIFDWMKENNLFERLFLIQTKDLFESNNISLIHTKYFWSR